MTWTAVVPLKPAAQRKGRLRERLDPEQRVALSLEMFGHVTAVLGRHPQVARVAVLSAVPPPGWRGPWTGDRRRGLNRELQDARRCWPGDFACFHADLPLLTEADVSALLAGASRAGIAIAPDRHGTGTNAVALRDDALFRFRFGPDSLRHHCDRAPDSAIVRPRGLAFDLDTPEDLALVHAQAGVEPFSAHARRSDIVPAPETRARRG